MDDTRWIRWIFALGLLVALPLAACTSEPPTCHPSGTELHIAVAKGTSHVFDTDCMAAPADQAFTIAFRNDDNSPHGAHNITILSEEDGEIVFSGEGLRPGGTSTVYEVQPLAAGNYTFRCDTHPFMDGTFIVEEVSS
jgi:plastocyanin